MLGGMSVRDSCKAAVGQTSDAERMFETRMSRRWEYVIDQARLLNSFETLEQGRVDDRDFVFREVLIS